MLKRISFSILLFRAATAFSQENTADTVTKQSMPIYKGWEIIEKLKPVMYGNPKEKQGAFAPGRDGQPGFVLSEVRSAVPGLIRREYRMVPKGKNGMRTVICETIDTEKLIPFLVNAIQEQQKEIRSLRSEMNAMAAQNPW